MSNAKKSAAKSAARNAIKPVKATTEPATSVPSQVKTESQVKTKSTLPGWASPELFGLIEKVVEEAVPHGEDAGDQRGKGITAYNILEKVGPKYGFKLGEIRVREKDGKPVVDEAGEQQTVLYKSPETLIAEAVVEAYLRFGVIPGLVARGIPTGGYGWEEDRTAWLNWPLTVRQFGPREKAYLKVPAVFLANVAAAIEALLPVPAGWTKDAKGSVPIDPKGNRLNKFASVTNIAQRTFDIVADQGVNLKEAATLYLTAAGETTIRNLIRAGLLGQLDFTKAGVFRLTPSEAAEVERNQRDVNIYDEENNPSGNKKAGGQPDFAFVAPPTLAQVKALEEQWSGDEGEIFSITNFLEMVKNAESAKSDSDAEDSTEAAPESGESSSPTSAAATTHHAPPPAAVRPRNLAQAS